MLTPPPYLIQSFEVRQSAAKGSNSRAVSDKAVCCVTGIPKRRSLELNNWALASCARMSFSILRTSLAISTTFDRSRGGGSKTKEISMKNIGVKVLITNQIIKNSKQTNLGRMSKIGKFIKQKSPNQLCWLTTHEGYPLSANTNMSANRNTKNVPF